MDENTLNDLLECSVCLDRLDISNKVLPCQHTFCTKCLEDIVSTHHELKCPECRVLTCSRIDELPPNVLLVRILGGMKSASNANIPKKKPLLQRLVAPAETLSRAPTTESTESVLIELKRPTSDPKLAILYDYITEQPPNNITEQPADVIAEQPANYIAEQPANYIAEQPVNYVAEQPANYVAEQPANYIAEQPADLTTEQPAPTFHLSDENQSPELTDLLIALCSGRRPENISPEVQAMIPILQEIPAGRALFSCLKYDGQDENRLTFNKNDVVLFTKKINDKWAEGRTRDRMGTFPIDLFHLNCSARDFMQRTPNSEPGPSRVVPPTSTADESMPLISTQNKPAVSSLQPKRNFVVPRNNTPASATSDSSLSSSTTPNSSSNASSSSSSTAPSSPASPQSSSLSPPLTVNRAPMPIPFSQPASKPPPRIPFFNSNNQSLILQTSHITSLPTHVLPTSHITSVQNYPRFSPPSQIISNNTPTPLPVPRTHRTPPPNPLPKSNALIEDTNNHKQREKRHSFSALAPSHQPNTANRHSAEILSSSEPVAEGLSLSRQGSHRHKRSGSDLVSTNSHLPAAYVALYPYKPQKGDELELKKGGIYVVTERCQDGWFKGTSNRTQKCGVFPGNYVTLAKPLHSSQARLGSSSPRDTKTPPPEQKTSHKNKSCYARQIELCKSQAPPELPPRQVHGHKLRQQHRLNPDETNFFLSIANEEEVEKSPEKFNERSIPMMSFNVSSVKSTGKIIERSNGHSTEKMQTVECSFHHGSQPSMSVVSPPNVSVSSNSSKTGKILAMGRPKPTSTITSADYQTSMQNQGIQPSMSVTSPPNVSVSSPSSKSTEKAKEEKKKSGLMKLTSRLTGMKRCRSPTACYSMDNPVFEDIATMPSSSLPVHVRSGSCPSQLKRVASEKKTLSASSARIKPKQRPSLDDAVWNSAPIDNDLIKPNHDKSNSSDDKDVRKIRLQAERYRCIVPYPPNSEHELELRIGDVLYLQKKRDDGWFKGVQQRTGRSGLFPASFVEEI